METLASTAETAKYMLSTSLHANYTDNYTLLLYQKTKYVIIISSENFMYKSVKQRWQQQRSPSWPDTMLRSLYFLFPKCATPSQ